MLTVRLYMKTPPIGREKNRTAQEGEHGGQVDLIEAGAKSSFFGPTVATTINLAHRKAQIYIHIYIYAKW